MLRERMPEVLAFIRDWIQQANGDELTLLLQALETQIQVAPKEADVRVEVPMIGAFEGADFATTARTSAWTFSNDKPEPASVPFRRTFARKP